MIDGLLCIQITASTFLSEADDLDDLSMVEAEMDAAGLKWPCNMHS
jgi:hypothetical protein